MTVEYIAKQNRRPLIRLSAADLGTEEVRMEKHLISYWIGLLSGALSYSSTRLRYISSSVSREIKRNALVTGYVVDRITSERANIMKRSSE